MKIGKDKNVERQRMYSEINHVGNSALPRKKIYESYAITDSFKLKLNTC
jgi:ribosomal protein S26